MTRRPQWDLQSIDVRRSGEREAGKRRERNSDARIRRRWSGTEIRRLAAAAVPAVSQITPRWREPLPRRSRKRRSDAGRDRGRMPAASEPPDRPHPAREAAGVRKVGLRLAGLNCGRRLRGDAVEMSERKRKLDGQRKQRQPRAVFDVRTEPLHADRRPCVGRPGISAVQCYIITSGMPGGCQPWTGCVR